MCAETLNCYNMCDLALTLLWAPDSQFKKPALRFEVGVHGLSVRGKLGKSFSPPALPVYGIEVLGGGTDPDSASHFSKRLGLAWWAWK